MARGIEAVVVAVGLDYPQENGGEERRWKMMEHHQKEYAMVVVAVEEVAGLVVGEVVEADGD